jgi:hypothetical protein
MARHIEWRRRVEGDESLLAIDDTTEHIVQVWRAEPKLLTDLLNDMVDFGPAGDDVEVSSLVPEDFGELVISRADDGDVLFIEPRLYWEGMAYWFRSHGTDPHPWRRERKSA